MATRSNYKKSRSKGKGSSQFKRNEEFDERKNSKKESANDPSWYTVSNQLVKDVASLSFNNPSGIQYFLDGSATGSFVNPGVMSIYMAPAAGYSEGLSSPINIAAKNIYSFVRHANSGSKNYDSPDLILYILAMDSAFSFYGWMTRLYGMLRIYSQTNRYFGANFLKACGVDADNILANLANFRAYINQYALKLSALCVPTSMSLFKRHMWMFSNVFSDEDDPKAQVYMYQPAYFYKYDEMTGGAGKLSVKPLCLSANGNSVVTGLTYGNIIAYGDDLLGAMIGSEDIGIMSGDILKAYGDGNIWKASLISEDYSIIPVFSEEVLYQIHNTVFVGGGPLKDTSAASSANWGWDSFEITQDPSIGDGCLICKPVVSKGGNIQANHVLDFWKKDVTPEDIIVASRNILTGARWSQGFTAVTGFGSEIPIFAAVFNLNANGTISSTKYYDSDNKANWNSTYADAAAALGGISKLSYFNEHPFIYLGTYDNTTAPYFTIDAGTCQGEMSNFTIVDSTDIEKMHLTAILSELAVPMLGNLVRG